MAEQGSALEDVDFEAMYQGLSAAGATMPWDIGGPQPALVALEDAGGFSGDVLDVGCGLGDNAAFLASRGYRVTGVDGAPTAIQQARERAATKGLDIEFAVTDATRLDGFEGRFDTVVDSALYHCLNEDERHSYIAALHRATKPGARLHLFCFGDDLPEGFPAPFRISEQNLRDTIGRTWNITFLGKTKYATSVTRDGFRQTMLRVLPDSEVDPEALASLEPDDQGRLKVPVWQLAAERA